MKRYRIIKAAVIIFFIMLAFGVNVYLMNVDFTKNEYGYRVELNRVEIEIRDFEKKNNYIPQDLEQLEDFAGKKYESIIGIEAVKKEEIDKDKYEIFDSNKYNYDVMVTEKALYRIDYKNIAFSTHKIIVIVNAILVILFIVINILLVYTGHRILAPFEKFAELPYELSKGNLVVPLKESRDHYFGKFLWGMDLLRENLEENKKRELELQKEKKLLLLSLSHDIKTPLSAIKLYARALDRKLYRDEKKQHDIAVNIDSKVNEIEGFISEIVTASNDDFMDFEVTNTEIYVKNVIDYVDRYYTEKMNISQIDFTIEMCDNCLIKGDTDRLIEIMQNIIENAIKYGDGKKISLLAERLEDEYIIEVYNTGCTLSEKELPHIFDSFFRGTNVEKSPGSGLGLYICRKLIHLMGGEIFAEIKPGDKGKSIGIKLVLQLA